jgi:hypothetical protein
MDSILSLLLAPIGLFVSYPFLGMLPAAIFLVYYLVRRPAAAALRVPGLVRWSLVCGLCWLAYTIYEFRMQAWSRTVHGAIRVDLVLVAPVLMIVTVCALWGCIRFERIARAGVAPPFLRAEPGDRTLVLAAALALAGFSIVDMLVQNYLLQAPWLERGWFGVILGIGLAFFMTREYPWARWLAGLRCIFGFVSGVFRWQSLAPAGDRFTSVRYWYLAGALFYAVLGCYIIFSKGLGRYAGGSVNTPIKVGQGSYARRR